MVGITHLSEKYYQTGISKSNSNSPSDSVAPRTLLAFG
jgi:hypothetical protein